MVRVTMSNEAGGDLTREPRRPASPPEELLRRLAAHDEEWLQAVLAPRSLGAQSRTQPPVLERRVRVLVELAGLLVANAPPTCLRGAVERAAASGAGDDVLVQVLRSAAGAAGRAQTVRSASRLALALDVDTGWRPALGKKTGVKRAGDRFRA